MSANKNLNFSEKMLPNKKFNSVIFKAKIAKNSSIELLTTFNNFKISNVMINESLGELKSNTSHVVFKNTLLGAYAPFVKVFIIRGIGFQADVIDNPTHSTAFPYNRYLLMRVGHSFLIHKPIPKYIGIKVHKKDRKVVLYGVSKEQVANFAKEIFKLRPPSVYTGRGIRIKKGLHRRKLGKKDIRKGKV